MNVELTDKGRFELAISDGEGHSEVVVWDHAAHRLWLVDKKGAVRSPAAHRLKRLDARHLIVGAVWIARAAQPMERAINTFITSLAPP